MRERSDKDSAVSAIIGTILMVVLVTILASVTALFVYQYLQSINQPEMISFSVTRLNPQTIEIFNNGGPSLNNLKTNTSITVEINGADANSTSGELDSTAGSIAYYTANTSAQVTIIGLFNDDKNHVLFEGTY
jgi:FlaG/FlaF family flagellin (archaellin)